MRDRVRFRVVAARDPLRRGLVVVPRRLVLAADVVAILGIAGLALSQHVSPDLLGYFGLGCGIGVVTCVPIGIANVMVIDAAHRHGATRAIGTGIGGALADGLYVSLGIFGIGPLLARYPSVPTVLRAVTGCVLVIYGIVLVRARPFHDRDPRETPPQVHGQLRRGVAVGLAATLLNPSAIVTWVLIVGAHAIGALRGEGAAWIAGIVVGTFAWFLVVAWLALRSQRVLGRNVVWMTRVVGAVVIASGLVSLGRAAA